MRRYAIFHNPKRNKPYSVVAQYRVFFMWRYSSEYTYETEEFALRMWRTFIADQEDLQAGRGKQITEWKP